MRNSGAHAVVEGVGDHGCEYMTRGVVIILGETGRNFGAGMSGGVAFVLDLENNFSSCINTDLVSHDNVTKSSDISVLRSLIERHHELTGSEMAGKVLGDWQQFLPRFLKAAPKFIPGANESIDGQQSQEPINEYTSVITPTAIT